MSILVYVAAAWPNQKVCRDVIRPALRSRSIIVNSRWLDEGDTALPGSTVPKDETVRAAVAKENFDDVRAAHVLLLFNPESMIKTGTGGRHVETGYALALGRPVFILGVRENVFHWDAGVVELFAAECQPRGDSTEIDSVKADWDAIAEAIKRTVEGWVGT